MPNFVPGIGPFEPDLMLIAEAPGKNEDEQCQPLVGPTGQMVNDYLFKAGTHRSEVYLTNVVKYRPPFNDMTKLSLINVDLDKSAESLWEDEIKLRKPKCILAMGNYALRAVMGWPLEWNKKNDIYKITDYRGSILTAKDGKTKVVPTIHPAALFSRYQSNDDSSDSKGGLDYVYTKLIQHDVSRAVEESKSRTLSLTDRHLDIARNSLDLYRFIREYAKCEKATCDIESINCIPVCVGFAFNRFHAISIPLLQSIGNIRLTEMGMNDLISCWRMIDELLRGKSLIGHNFKYDDFKLGLSGFNCRKVISDTLIKTRVLFPELPDKRLNTVSSLWTREPYYKDEGKEFKLGKSRIDQLFLYNGRDCAVDFEVDEAQEEDLIGMQEEYHVPLVDYYYNYMMKKHKFYLQMENNGFNVDEGVRAELRSRYSMMREDVHERLVSNIGHNINVKSPPQKILLLREMGIKPFVRNPTAEDAIVKYIGNHCKGKDANLKKKILEDVLEETRIRDQESRYINFMPDYDRRCKTSFNISATETCRSSTSVLKKPLRPKKLGLAFHTISKHGRLARDIRSMFIPDKGKVFIQADSSQAEARVVAVLSKDWELLEAFDKVDIHRRTAGVIFGMTPTLNLSTEFIPGVDDLDKDGSERFTGKTTRHAGNYNMGKGRHMTEFNTAAQKADKSISISEWRAGENLRLFHEASPRIRGVFHSDITAAIQSTRCLIDPFGGVRIFNGRMDEELYKEGFANIPQRTVAHLVQGAAIRVSEELNGDTEVMFLNEAHDALLMSVPENNWMPYALLLKKHMEYPIDFSRYCTLKRDYVLTIPCDVEMSGKSYADLRKVKL